MRALLILVCFSGVMCVLGANAQESVEGRAAAANAAYTAKDWAKAEPIYEQLAQSQPNNARNWYRLGVSLQGLGKHREAVEALQKAQAKGAPAQNVDYALAGAYSAMGDKDQAIGSLTAAVTQGYAQPDEMKSDPALDSVRQDSRFAALLEKAQHNQSPCTFAPEKRQFDFWVGDWDVVSTQDGVAAGKSHIERTIGDCVIWENWTSLGNLNYFGKSYNAYNPNLKRWEQFWVDNGGDLIHFYGGLQDDVMDFYTDDLPQPDGTKLKRHLQFFNQGADKVRQFSQGSTDGGKTWKVEYDLTYNRRK